MKTISQYNQQVEQYLYNIPYPKETPQLFAPIEYTLKLGGKRIRPTLLLMATEMFGGSSDTAVPAAAAIEIFHNFTLLHDDLMDKSPTRRGQPSVHVKWNANQAILSGDAMHIYAYRLLKEIPQELLSQTIDTFTQTTIEIHQGQQLDMDFENESQIKEEQYIEMIRLKTAVLLGCALKIGATIGNATSENAELLYQFGIHLGIAFQLQDDYLDVYGDYNKLGKPIGGDILNNKKTFLLINAFDRASSEKRLELNNWLNNTTAMPEQKIKAVTNIYNQLNIPECCNERIMEHYQKAWHCLEQIQLPSEKKQPLIDLAKQLLNRQV